MSSVSVSFAKIEREERAGGVVGALWVLEVIIDSQEACRRKKGGRDEQYSCRFADLKPIRNVPIP